MKTEFLGSNLHGLGAPEILNALADGAYITDRERRILFWSRAAERITGWSAREVVGHTCAENILVHVDKDGRELCGQEHCPLHRAIVTGEISCEPLLVFAQHKQGYRVPVEVSVAPVRDQNGETVAGIEVFRDWTGVLEDLRRAKMVQEQALSCRVPEDERVHFEVAYSPEELVGGDFYRFEALDADHYVVMVADVMGHGMASALYTMQLRSLWEECREDLGHPSQFVGELNRRLYRLTSPEGYFATGVFLWLDAAGGELRYIRAGHPSPMVMRADGKIERLTERGSALGLLQDATFGESEAHLDAGDGLLVFTDGAVEIANAEGSELGESGLLQLVEALGEKRLDLRQIERKLLEFTRDIRLPDDLTLLSIRRSREH